MTCVNPRLAWLALTESLVLLALVAAVVRVAWKGVPANDRPSRLEIAFWTAVSIVLLALIILIVIPGQIQRVTP